MKWDKNQAIWIRNEEVIQVNCNPWSPPQQLMVATIACFNSITDEPVDCICSIDRPVHSL